MQQELDGEMHALPIRILGLNQSGYESGNATVCSGRDIPWLQDVPAQDVWTAWGVVYRDVIILDDQNQVVDVFNLTEHDLQDPLEYAALKALLTGHANPMP